MIEITDEMVEEAAEAVGEGDPDPISREWFRMALAAVAPLIEAQALEKAALICSPANRGLYDWEMRAYGDHFAEQIRALKDKAPA